MAQQTQVWTVWGHAYGNDLDDAHPVVFWTAADAEAGAAETREYISEDPETQWRGGMDAAGNGEWHCADGCVFLAIHTR